VLSNFFRRSFTQNGTKKQKSKAVSHLQFISLLSDPSPTMASQLAVSQKKHYKKAFNIISNGARQAGINKLIARMSELELNTSAPKRVITGRTKDGVVGSDKSKSESIMRYEDVWKAFVDFCFLIEDYESAMLPSRALCPDNPIPVKLRTAVLYMQYRVNQEGTPLKDLKTGELIHDFENKVVYSVGNWRSQSTVGIFRSAMSKIHSHYETTKGPYIEACPECGKLSKEAVCKGEGCIQHPGDPHYWRRGNVTKDEEFKKSVQDWQDYAEHNYEQRSSAQLLPGEVRDIRIHLLSYNDLYHLMLWTIIIVGIKMFLRVEEVLELTIEQFVEEYFQVSEDAVQGLCSKIKGKRDPGWLHFMIWNDIDCPEFSACNAILIWVRLSGIKSGQLFPPKEELDLVKTMGHTDSHLSYECFLGVMKNLLIVVLKRDESNMGKQIIGTHLLRKTAFLFAKWGFSMHFTKNTDITKELPVMEVASILLSARHKSSESTATYLDDCGTLEAHVLRDPVNRERHRVGKWEPIHMSALPSFASLLLESRKHQKPLPALAHWYIDKICGGPSNTDQFSIARVHEKATGYKPAFFLEEELKARLFEKLSAVEAEQMWQMITKHTESRVRAAQCLLPATKGGTNNDTINNKRVIDVGECEVVEHNNNKRHKLDTTNSEHEVVVCFVTRDFRDEFAKTHDKSKKVQVYIDAVTEVQDQVRHGKALIDPLKSWSYRAGRVAACVAECYKSNIDDFLAAHPRGLSKFKCPNECKHEPTFDRCKLT
jgi:hypothetical protein